MHRHPIGVAAAVLVLACGSTGRRETGGEPEPVVVGQGADAQPSLNAAGERGGTAAIPDPSIATDATHGDASSELDRHRVTFADRSTHSYLLLLEGNRVTSPSVEGLGALLQEEFGQSREEPETELLFAFVRTPIPMPRAFSPRPDDVDGESGLMPMPNRGPAPDLLGFHIELLSDAASRGLVPPAVLQDLISTRELNGAERQSLPRRKHALLVRADYRNQHAVRGLRMLQTVAIVLARQHGALIYDPDTQETVGLETFIRRRFRKSVGNVADQLAVIPFRDDDSGPGLVRLTTRGMRRFGSPDLEVAGLPPDSALLQRVTHMVYGLAFRMLSVGEVDPSGYAVEISDSLSVQAEDVAAAYANRPFQVTPCRDCPGQVMVHLVMRDKRDDDPQDHLVVRVVAPRSQSDKPDYDHVAWVRKATTDLLGP